MDIETSNIASPEGQAVESHNALDDLLKQATDTPVEDPKPAAETPAPVADPAIPAETPKPVETPAPAAKDALDDVQLPPYSKPKTGEAFAQVKTIAREQLSKRDAEIKRLSDELAAREAKLKDLPSDDVKKQWETKEKELEELRNFRRSTDIENDPTFRAEYDGKITANTNLIFNKLAEAGMDAKQIEEAKKLGLENINWDPIFEAVNPALRHLISAKLGANLELKDAKAAAIDAARKEPSKFETQRHEAQSKTLTETSNAFLKQMGWTATKDVPANATPEQKAEIEAHNKTAKEAMSLVQTALKDYSPETFAELAVGTAAAHKYKADYMALKVAHEAATTKHKTELETVTKERDTAKAELEKIKKAGRTHIRTTAQPAAPAPDTFTVNGADALDRLRAEHAD